MWASLGGYAVGEVCFLVVREVNATARRDGERKISALNGGKQKLGWLPLS